MPRAKKTVAAAVSVEATINVAPELQARYEYLKHKLEVVKSTMPGRTAKIAKLTRLLKGLES